MNVVYLIGPDRKETKITNDKDPFRFLNFPLFVGKKWVVHSKEGSSSFSGEFQVEGVEEVQTPAGRFMTFRIHLKQTNLSSKRAAGFGTGTLRRWGKG